MISNFGTRSGQKRARGFSLVELAIVLGILSFVLGSLWSVVSSVRENIRKDEAFDQIVLVVRTVRDFYLGRGYVETPAGSGSFSDLTNYLLREGVLPPEMIRDRSAGTLRADHPWGPRGAGTLLNEGGFAVDNTGVSHSSSRFRIQLRGLTFSNCVDLAVRVSSPEGPSGLISVKINGHSNEDLPVTVEEASKSCEENPSGTDNKVDFVYRLRVL